MPSKSNTAGFITRSRKVWLTSIFQMFADFMQEAVISNTLSNNVYLTCLILGSIKTLMLEPSGNVFLPCCLGLKVIAWGLSN